MLPRVRFKAGWEMKIIYFYKILHLPKVGTSMFYVTDNFVLQFINDKTFKKEYVKSTILFISIRSKESPDPKSTSSVATLPGIVCTRSITIRNRTGRGKHWKNKPKFNYSWRYILDDIICTCIYSYKLKAARRVYNNVIRAPWFTTLYFQSIYVSVYRMIEIQCTNSPEMTFVEIGFVKMSVILIKTMRALCKRPRYTIRGEIVRFFFSTRLT